MKNYTNLVAIIFAGCLLVGLFFVIYNQINKTKVEKSPAMPNAVISNPSITPPERLTPLIR